MRSIPIALASVLALSTAAAAQPFANVKINRRANNPQETSIAINPTNPDNIVAVAQSPCHYYASFDGGLTWTDQDLPDPYDFGDPAVCFDAGGFAYYCYIGTWGHSGIFVNRTTDGGTTWRPAGSAIIEHNGNIPFEDKSYHCADWSDSPYRHNLYVAWTQFTEYGSPDPADSTWILFSRSTDRGVTFSPPIRVSDRGGNAVDSDDTVEGAVPSVGPDGTVYLAWSGPRGIEFDRSTDGGVSFGADRVIADQPGGWAFEVGGIYRCNGFPVTKVDLSYGPHRGRVYVNWSDQRNGDTDVFLIHSDDGGESWSPVRRVNDDPLGNGKEQFFTWIDVDPVTGIVYIVFYDRRDQPGIETDVYLAISEDGGETFQNMEISDGPFIPNPTAFFGDYTGISTFAGRVRPIWTRMENTTRTIWTALIDRPNAGFCETPPAPGCLQVFPNPIRDRAQIIGCEGFDGVRELTVQDIAGRTIRRLEAGSAPGAQILVSWDGRDERGRRVASGLYFVSGEGIEAARVVVLR